MANIIDHLRAEHADMAMILNILEKELDECDGRNEPDYALIQNIADYFLDYPDACHHPKEDIVYRMLVASRPGSTGSVVNIENEHEVIGKLARDFAASIRSVKQAGGTPPLSFFGSARRFIESQRHHLNLEETKLFPMALDALTDDDWAAVDARIERETDPVFGTIEVERFNALRNAILSRKTVQAAE